MKTVETIVSEVWPEWRLESRIGAGTFGEVYRARREDAAGISEAAIKVICMDPQNLRLLYPAEEERQTAFERMTQRVCREIQMMQSLKGHTNLVSIEDYRMTEDRESGRWYMLTRMELLTPLLVDLDLRPCGEEQLIRMGIDLSRGLEVCARENIVHRDIKPENILLNRQGDYKLGDFSVARTLAVTRETLTDWDFVRAERFTAPEVKKGELQEASFEEYCRADIYSLGMVLYWIANGQRFPFLPEKQLYSSRNREEAEQKRLNGDALPAPEGISPGLQAVILRACAYDSKKRFESAQAFREALEKLSGGSADDTEKNAERTGQDVSGNRGEEQEAGGQPPAERKRHGMRWFIAAFAAALFLLLWLGLPVKVPVSVETAEGKVLYSGEVSLRPGCSRTVRSADYPQPEGYACEEPADAVLSVSLLRVPAAAEIRFVVAKAEEPDTSLPLHFESVAYPHVYAMGLPCALSGAVASDVPLSEIAVNIYTPETVYTYRAELPENAKSYATEDLGQLFGNLEAGPFWFELLAADASGRKIGFSHFCTASLTAAEHTFYSTDRIWMEPELTGTYVYGGHTYEVYRMSGGGWNTAKAFAQGKGGHLVTFADDDEFDMVGSFCLGMGIKYLSIGAEYTDGAWSWVDGTPFTFRRWNPASLEDGAYLYDPVGGMVYTSAKQWFFGKATQYEMGYFIVEYDDILC